MATAQNYSEPYVSIEEQPASKAMRFRYESEGRAGSIPGENSTESNPTFPTIQVNNYVGNAVVAVSCVTHDKPYKWVDLQCIIDQIKTFSICRPHPHSIVGRDGCENGICWLRFTSRDMKLVFSNLGIQCVKIKGITEALALREKMRVDPYRSKWIFLPFHSHEVICNQLS